MSMHVDSSYSALEHVPSCSKAWPPTWMTTPSLPPAEPTPTPPVQAPPTISSWDLSPDQFELWEERTCVMHYDGGLPWDEAERLAMQDILKDA